MEGDHLALVGGDKFMHGAQGEEYSCMCVCVCRGGLVPVVCFTASSWSNMIISQAAVAWQTRQIHRGTPENGPRSSTATFCCVWWEKEQRYGMRAKVPLRAIKYSSAIRHQALGSIPTESTHQGHCSPKQQQTRAKYRRRKCFHCFHTWQCWFI